AGWGGTLRPLFANVLVNDPAADTTSRDTQSETAVVLGAGGTVVPAFVDTGSLVPPAPLGLGGWATSTAGGPSFTDKGRIPRAGLPRPVPTRFWSAVPRPGRSS